MELPQIEVVWHRRSFFSLDNRRLAAHRLVALALKHRWPGWEHRVRVRIVSAERHGGCLGFLCYFQDFAFLICGERSRGHLNRFRETSKFECSKCRTRCAAPKRWWSIRCDYYYVDCAVPIMWNVMLHAQYCPNQFWNMILMDVQ